VYPGEQTVISWRAEEAKSVYFYPVGQNWRVHPVGVVGDFVDTLSHTTQYELRVVHGDGSVETLRVRVEVLPYEPPKIRYFRAKWERKIENQLCVRIEWDVKGRAAMVNLFRNGAFVWLDTPDTVVMRDCVPVAGKYTYTLEALGPGGKDEQTCTIEIGQ
jgi:hypothetical protein